MPPVLAARDSTCSGAVDSELEETCASAFDLVSQNLANLGSLSLNAYLQTPTPYDSKELHQTVPPPTPLAEPLPPVPITPSKPTETVSVNAVTRLHQACQRVCGSIEPLQFNFMEDDGPSSKQCVLTITLRDGSKRSYTTKPTFSRKNEAKAEAAKIAIEMGALEFLFKGDPDASKANRGLVLASIGPPQDNQTTMSASTSQTEATDPSVSAIEACCVEWRAGSVVPHWVALFEPKIGHKQGCALRIELSPHSVRVYSSDTVFATYAEAKSACAKIAVDEGVLEFIKHGNGQTRPVSPQLFIRTISDEVPNPSQAAQPLTLQGFYDTLPRPFPEDFKEKSASDINAPGWLNSMIQAARGSKLTTTFIFTSDGTPGLHGCLLKLERPGESRAYLVDPRFPKRAEAKAAVCFQAMSQKIGDYIRSIGAAVENKVTSLIRSWVSEHISPVLASECNKIRPGMHPRYEYDKEKDAFGCTMILELSIEPTPAEIRKFTVPAEYRTKADAKIGVICQAAEQGAIEFLRFRGEPPPLGYESPFLMKNYDPNASRKLGKRKQPEESDTFEDRKEYKKRKKGTVEEEGEVALSDAGSSSGGHGQGGTAKRGGQQDHNSPGSSGTGPSWGSAQAGHPSDHYHADHRGVGGSAVPYNAGNIHPGAYAYPGHPPAHAAPPFSYAGVPEHFIPGPYAAPYPPAPHLYGAFPPYPPPGGMHPQLFVPPYPPSSYSALPYSDAPGPANGSYGPLHAPHVAPQAGSTGHTLQRPRQGSKKKGPHATSENTGGNSQGPSGGEHFRKKNQSKKQKRETRNSTPSDSSSLAREPSTQPNPSKSHVKALTDYCSEHRLAAPQFHHEIVPGSTSYKVWIIVGKERLELPTTFRSAVEGHERVSKQVLNRLRSQIKVTTEG
ncbi:hypothetical protein BV22DRAFT_1131453 [Leucogyrophana mollusca]|uniref:Uncharacterized protein n=1 Tax=Leucogyrophana mollusca TaxID=85980 RepID=A0ACB8B9T2_9AGAM|nr:hypothetical protein BV22DRAFT_1131453 [Leucogyrophana mollusca]